MLWDVELEDTVVFPEGGGQPWDTGVLTLGELELPVEGCVRRGLAAVHHVRVPADVDLSSLPSAAPGSPATVGIHWHRRADHMVTHTAQHLLSAVLDTRGLPTLSWAMDANPGTDAYVELPRGITWAEAQSVEDECNVHIAKNLRVWIDVNVQREGEGPDTAGEGQESDVDRENRVIPKDYTGVSPKYWIVLTPRA